MGAYHRSHRPWKSLQDFHTPTARRLLINNEVQKTRRSPQVMELGVSQLRVAVQVEWGQTKSGLGTDEGYPNKIHRRTAAWAASGAEKATLLARSTGMNIA